MANIVVLESEKSVSEKIVIAKLCDCHVSTTRFACKLFFGIYIGLLVALIIAVLAYRYSKKQMIRNKQ